MSKINYLLTQTREIAAHTAAKIGSISVMDHGSCCNVAAAAVDDFPVADRIGHGCLCWFVVCVNHTFELI